MGCIASKLLVDSAKIKFPESNSYPGNEDSTTHAYLANSHNWEGDRDYGDRYRWVPSEQDSEQGI